MVIGKEIVLDDSKFENTCTFNDSKCGLNFQCNRSRFTAIVLSSVSVGTNVSLKSLTAATSNGGIDLCGSRIEGEVSISFSNENTNPLEVISLASAEVGELDVDGNSKLIRFINLKKLRVQGAFSLSNSKVYELSANSLSVDGTACFSDIALCQSQSNRRTTEPTTVLDLQDAHFKTASFSIVADKNLYCGQCQQIKLEGITYQYLDKEESGKRPSWKALLKILNLASLSIRKNNPQPKKEYNNLYNYLTESSMEQEAYLVMKSMYSDKFRVLRHHAHNFSSFERLTEWLYLQWGYYTHFGKYPWKTFLHFVFLAAIGIAIYNPFWLEISEDGKKYIPEGQKPKWSDATFFAFDMAIPFFDLKAQENWKPIFRWQIIFGYFYKVVGIVLTTIFFMVLSGIFK
jgi:hypothetical protein